MAPLGVRSSDGTAASTAAEAPDLEAQVRELKTTVLRQQEMLEKIQNQLEQQQQARAAEPQKPKGWCADIHIRV